MYEFIYFLEKVMLKGKRKGGYNLVCICKNPVHNNQEKYNSKCVNSVT